MKMRYLILAIILISNIFYSPGLRAEESSVNKEYLVKFKTNDPVLIKSLGEKYGVVFKETIPELQVYSFQANRHSESIRGALSQEETVVYVEPNIRAKTTYADVGGMQEIITDAPWYLAPNRTEIPILLFVPEVYWKGAKGSGLQLTNHRLTRIESGYTRIIRR